VDLTDQIGRAINGWIKSLADAITGPTLKAAGQLLFQTPDFTAIPDVRRFWLIGVGIADTAFVLAALWAGILIMASGTVDAAYSGKRLLSRLVLAAVLTNASLPLCAGLIGFENALLAALVGSNPTANVWGQAVSHMSSQHLTVEVLAALMSIALAAIALLLVAVYIVRDVILLVATVIAPLALATYSVPRLDEAASLWWRVYALGLFVQVVQAEVLNVGLGLVGHADLLGAPASEFFDVLVLLILLYVLAKMPFWAFRWAFGHSFSNDHIVQRLAATARAWRPGG
jgi:hypothetical protein